jgi:uncharacterized membrane protein
VGFSLQATHAAPLILLVQRRQADRDKMMAMADAHHREETTRESVSAAWPSRPHC